MEKKYRLSMFFTISILLILVYIFFAAKPLSKEYQYNPEWKINTLNPVISENNSVKKNAF